MWYFKRALARQTGTEKHNSYCSITVKRSAASLVKFIFLKQIQFAKQNWQFRFHLAAGQTKSYFLHCRCLTSAVIEGVTTRIRHGDQQMNVCVFLCMYVCMYICTRVMYCNAMQVSGYDVTFELNYQGAAVVSDKESVKHTQFLLPGSCSENVREMFEENVKMCHKDTCRGAMRVLVKCKSNIIK